MSESIFKQVIAMQFGRYLGISSFELITEHTSYSSQIIDSN
jgi:hypothetical protein